MNKTAKKIILSITGLLVAVIVAFGVFVGIRCSDLSKEYKPPIVDSEELNVLTESLFSQYKDRYNVLTKLPYSIPDEDLDVWAKSVIVLNASNGNILYERNADEVIPPASMTKLFAMYVVDEEVSKGNLSYDQIIPLPEESWACNMPPRSSLMFLGEGQRVTLEELLLGLSICSGNDAAYALAYTVCGTMEAFVERMNQVAVDLGLEHTHFVESSGYSELNTTTPREMAKFATVYLKNHPDSLKRFHSVESFTYPKKQNLAPGDILQAQDFSQGFPRHITMPITQENTNPLLGKLRGCDGLKTGYIDESGYNLALTACRNGTRYISVTMRGPGNNMNEGQAGRVHDGTNIMEWAFRNFANYQVGSYMKPYFVKSYNGSEKGLNLIPAFTEECITVPYVTGVTMEENLENVKVTIDIPEYTWGTVEAGETLGSIKITLGSYVLDEIPLVADRNIEESNFMNAIADKIYLLFQ